MRILSYWIASKHMTYPAQSSIRDPVILIRNGMDGWLYAAVTHHLETRQDFAIHARQKSQDVEDVLETLSHRAAVPKLLRLFVDESMLKHPSWSQIERILRIHQDINLALVIHCDQSFRLPMTFVAWVQFVVTPSQESLICTLSHYLCLDIAANSFQVILPLDS